MSSVTYIIERRKGFYRFTNHILMKKQTVSSIFHICFLLCVSASLVCDYVKLYLKSRRRAHATPHIPWRLGHFLRNIFYLTQSI
jgi:hypothetical protein